MRLKGIINNARNRELRQLSVKDKTDEVIVSYINLALIALYSRFQLRTEEIILKLVTGKVNYKIDGTDSDVYKGTTVFTDNDVMGIVKAFNEEKEISVNKDNDPLSVFTISYDTIQVPYATTGDYISLIYRASPTEIEFVDDGDGTAQDADVKLPVHMMEALLAHIGYSAYSSVDIAQQTKVNLYMDRFDKACSMLETLGLVPQDTLTFDVDRKGLLV